MVLSILIHRMQQDLHFLQKRIKRHEGFGAINTPFLEDIEYEVHKYETS